MEINKISFPNFYGKENLTDLPIDISLTIEDFINKEFETQEDFINGLEETLKKVMKNAKGNFEPGDLQIWDHMDDDILNNILGSRELASNLSAQLPKMEKDIETNIHSFKKEDKDKVILGNAKLSTKEDKALLFSIGYTGEIYQGETGKDAINIFKQDNQIVIKVNPSKNLDITPHIKKAITSVIVSHKMDATNITGVVIEGMTETQQKQISSFLKKWEELVNNPTKLGKEWEAIDKIIDNIKPSDIQKWVKDNHQELLTILEKNPNSLNDSSLIFGILGMASKDQLKDHISFYDAIKVTLAFGLWMDMMVTGDPIERGRKKSYIEKIIKEGKISEELIEKYKWDMKILWHDLKTLLSGNVTINTSPYWNNSRMYKEYEQFAKIGEIKEKEKITKESFQGKEHLPEQIIFSNNLNERRKEIFYHTPNFILDEQKRILGIEKETPFKEMIDRVVSETFGLEKITQRTQLDLPDVNKTTMVKIDQLEKEINKYAFKKLLTKQLEGQIKQVNKLIQKDFEKYMVIIQKETLRILLLSTSLVLAAKNLEKESKKLQPSITEEQLNEMKMQQVQAHKVLQQQNKPKVLNGYAYNVVINDKKFNVLLVEDEKGVHIGIRDSQTKDLEMFFYKYDEHAIEKIKLIDPKGNRISINDKNLVNFIKKIVGLKPAEPNIKIKKTGDFYLKKTIPNEMKKITFDKLPTGIIKVSLERLIENTTELFKSL